MWSKNVKPETVYIADKMFTTLHEVPEIDQFLDVINSFFKKKYGIDYLSVHIVHHTKSNAISLYGHDELHEMNYALYGGLAHKGWSGDHYNSTIRPNEFYIEYFDTVMNLRETDERAEVMGERKYGGSSLIVSDELNNMTLYDMTFADDSSLGTLSKKVLYELTADLIHYKSLLLPFTNHLHQFGDFSDKRALNLSMDKFIQKNYSLFHF